MCGIAGIFSLDSRNVCESALRPMADIMVHRGPDDEGLDCDARVGLAMRRLSIIGVANGQQPIYNEDATVAVVLNGEIYNYPELKAELLRLGHRFKTESDVEVAVHLYEEHGARFIEHLRGMFAVALHDRSQGKLLLARDRTGQKPLYYAVHDGMLVFGSEIKTLHASGLVPKILNEEALTSYLVWGFVAGETTLFRHVRKLPAGYVMTVTQGGVETSRYWDVPQPKPEPPSVTDAVRRVRELTEEAIRIRLMSEVPLGAYLSGGIDSSVVVGVMTRFLERTVHTFAVGFDAAELDELPHARRVARQFRTRHHEVLVRDCSPELLREINWYYDEPAADPAAVPTFCLTRFAKQHITVALTGEGGDETFAGYPHYRNLQRLDRVERRLPGFSTVARSVELLQPLLGGFGTSRFWKSVWLSGLAPGERARGWVAAFTDRELARVLRPGLNGLGQWAGFFRDLQASRTSSDRLTQLLYIDTKLTLADQLLMKVDKMTMASSLEARSPLLDHELLEYAAALPIDMKISQRGTKLVLREAFSDLLPQEILNRPKQGFDVPLTRWLTRDLQPVARELLLADGTAVSRYFRTDAVRSMWRRLERRGDSRLGRQLWRLLNFALWHELHWPRGAAVETVPHRESSPFVDVRVADFSA